MRVQQSIATLSFCSILALSACSSLPKDGVENGVKPSGDPLETVNRAVFDVNDFLDRLLIRPLAELYRVTVPPPIRDRIAAILRNMDEPVVFANNLLQGRLSDAGTTATRFLINTTLGGAGMFEVASGYGFNRQVGDFGQTLHTWGLGEGAYLVLPVLGPSNLRDAVGLGVDTVISPWKYVVSYGDSRIEGSFAAADLSASGLTRREANIEGLDALREGSLDFYAQMRSVYRQYRAKQLGMKLGGEMPVFDDYDAENSSPVIR